MRRDDALVDERLQTAAAVPDRPLPVLARAAAAQVLELARREPLVLVFDAAAAAAAAQPQLVQVRGGRLAPHRQDVRGHRVVPVGRRLARHLLDLLRLLRLRLLRGVRVLVGQRGVRLLPAARRDRFLRCRRLLNDYVGRLQVAADVADDRVARQEAVAVDAQHLLEVRQLIGRDDIERGADQRADRQRHRDGNDRTAFRRRRDQPSRRPLAPLFHRHKY